VGAITSPVHTDVTPKLVKIDKRLSYTTGHMHSPPSPSKTLMLAKTSGGTTGIGAAGGSSAEGDMGARKQKFTLSPHIRKDIVPACTSISSPAVARNGLPKMIDT